MWQTIHAVRNIDCSSDDANSVFVTFKSASEQGDSEVLCKIHYQTVSTKCSKNLPVEALPMADLQISFIIPHPTTLLSQMLLIS